MTDWRAACVPDQYYADVADIINGDGAAEALAQALHVHLQKDHVQLPYSDSSTDVWDALKVLDALDSDINSGKVELVYTAPELAVSNDETIRPLNWNREHVWPKSRGIGDSDSNPAYTDVHHLRACEPDVNSSRGNKPFDECDAASCRIPAHKLAEGDSAADSVVWRPPAGDRGALARSVLYMHLRYDADGEAGVIGDLQVSNCPGSLYMGKLATLVDWHNQYPPNEWEVRRNGLACSEFQHNRNPFIDFPALVDRIFNRETFVDPVAGCTWPGEVPPQVPSTAPTSSPSSSVSDTPSPSASPSATGSLTVSPTLSPSTGDNGPAPADGMDETLVVVFASAGAVVFFSLLAAFAVTLFRRRRRTPEAVPVASYVSPTKFKDFDL